MRIATATATAVRHRTGVESGSEWLDRFSWNLTYRDDAPEFHCRNPVVETAARRLVDGVDRVGGSVDTATKLPLKIAAVPAHRRHLHLDVALFVGQVHRLASGDAHIAVDEVYRFIDTRLLDGGESALTECDDALATVVPSKLTVAQIVSFLIVTRRARAKGLLPSRDKFFSRAVEAIASKQGPEKADRILRKYW